MCGRGWTSATHGTENSQETTEKIIQVKQRTQVTRDRQKSYADLKHKPMDFQVRDKVGWTIQGVGIANLLHSNNYVVRWITAMGRPEFYMGNSRTNSKKLSTSLAKTMHRRKLESYSHEEQGYFNGAM
ncbi:hypothetical protein Tco_0543989 [Tanacetum coccineum]